MKTLLVVGSDKLGRLAVSKICKSDSVEIVFDKSTNLKRICKLLMNRRLSIFLIIKMLLCEFTRSEVIFDREFRSIKNNKDIMEAITNDSFDRIILFRAGLIVNQELINYGIPILNVHAAKIPEYGGIGSIHRALSDGAIEQFASLHRVTQDIDGGELIDKENYILKLDASYCANEFIAYRAAIVLLKKIVKSPVSG